MYFASDNCSGAHPLVMDALLQANLGYTPSYGDDPIMEQVRAKIRDLFEAPEAAIYLVATGTTANVLSLATHASPWQAIYCHPLSHIHVDECNAPEFYTGGAKLKLVDGENGLITPAALETAIATSMQGDVHCTQRGVVSITNLSELGTLYSVATVRALGAIAHSYDLPMHMDGARFSNALVAAGCSPAEMTWKSGVDILSFGGTKNGLLGVEAVVLFDPEKSWEFELRRKRGGHLFSKHRFLSAQMQAYLQDGLWTSMATSANEKAARLSQGIRALPDGSLAHPTDANMIFASMPRARHRRAMAAGAQYFFMSPTATTEGPDDELLTARFVCSWSTRDDDVDEFLKLVQG